ncbi:unnamed protein product [Closterium sp. Naga37s-1]|nr:unnamed protein product [Closterium sp. Naga37s-1]
MAHSLHTLAVALLIASFSSNAFAGFMGGASTFAGAGKALVDAYNRGKKPAQQVVPYDPVGSGAGITGFNGGTYQIAISDDPMTSTQEGSAPPKITVPLCVSTFSFFVNGAPGVVLTVAQTYSIYKGDITVWSGVAGAKGKVAGAITRVARSDKSGSTAIVKTLWSKALGATYTENTDVTAMGYTGLTKVDGTTGMCTAIAKTKGAIGYAFTGSCAPRYLTFLRNANGAAVKAPAWNPSLAIPATPPAAPDASWASVDFVWKAGAKTPPMVSMEFAFIRKSPSTPVAKAFMLYMIGAMRTNKYGFNPTPPAWINPSKAMVVAINLTPAALLNPSRAMVIHTHFVNISQAVKQRWQAIVITLDKALNRTTYMPLPHTHTPLSATPCSPPLQHIPLVNISQAVKQRWQAITILVDKELNKTTYMLFNGKGYEEPATETPKVGTSELWHIINPTFETHPIHLHLIQHRPISRRPFNSTAYLNGSCSFEPSSPFKPSCFTGPARPVPQHERGWKDNTVAFPDSVLTIFVPFKGQDGKPFPFDATKGPGYVWHCHSLGHEDNDMIS